VATREFVIQLSRRQVAEYFSKIELNKESARRLGYTVKEIEEILNE